MGAHQPGYGDCGVMGPYRPTVVADGVEAGGALSQGPQAEAAVEVGTVQAADNGVSFLVVQQAGPEQVPDVGRERVDRAAISL